MESEFMWDVDNSKDAYEINFFNSKFSLNLLFI